MSRLVNEHYIPVGYSTAVKLVEISKQRNADVIFENQESELPYYALEKSGDLETRFEKFGCYRDRVRVLAS